MSGKSEEQKTLRDMLAELMGMIRKIGKLQDEIDELYGVRMVTGFIPGMLDHGGGDINVRRGMEEVEKALGVESKVQSYSTFIKEIKYHGIHFAQYADEKTKVFVKAGKKPPKVVLVEEDEE